MSTRRKPKQARSLQRYHQILDTSAQIFEDIGVESATTNLIAERANMSIGSLYQYFPNKDAILEGLVERYIDEYREFNHSKYDGLEIDSMTVSEVIHFTIDSIVAFEAEHTGFNTVFAQSASLSEQLASATADLHSEVVQQVCEMMHLRFPRIPRSRMCIYGAVVVSIVKNIKQLTSPPDSLPRQDAITEVKHAVLAYIRDILQREDLPLPEDLT